MQWLLYISGLIRYGRYVMPFDAGSRFAPIAGSDIALTAARIFTRPEDHAGRTYTLTGPVEYSHEELAAEVGRVLGRSNAHDLWIVPREGMRRAYLPDDPVTVTKSGPAL